MPYIANTAADREAMLKIIGVKNINELWQQAMVSEPVPSLDFIAPGKSEIEVTRMISGLASLNRPDLVCFAGCGYYDRLIGYDVDDVSNIFGELFG